MNHDSCELWFILKQPGVVVKKKGKGVKFLKGPRKDTSLKIRAKTLEIIKIYRSKDLWLSEKGFYEFFGIEILQVFNSFTNTY
jgi:hypothetical protein